MRSGKNALETIAAVKDKLKSLQTSLPKGVEIVPVYDRSGLIERAVKNLGEKLLEEFIVVALVCLAFLFHLRSALVASISLPLGVLMAFIVMQQQGINANVMSLGGIAIAIGAMIDAAIVMIENAHKHLERLPEGHSAAERFEAMLAGVPSITIGDAVMRPISTTEPAKVESPKLASDTERQQILNFLAYQQWTMAEMLDGKAWPVIRRQIFE